MSNLAMSAPVDSTTLLAPSSPLHAFTTSTNGAPTGVDLPTHHTAPSNTSAPPMYLTTSHDKPTPLEAAAAHQPGTRYLLGRLPHDPIDKDTCTPAACGAAGESSVHRSPLDVAGGRETQVPSSEEPEGGVVDSERTALHEEDVQERLRSVMKEREEEDGSAHSCCVRESEDVTEDASCETWLERANAEEKEYGETGRWTTTDFSMTEAEFLPSTEHLPSRKDSEVSSLTKTVEELHTKLQHLENECCMYKNMAHSMKGNIRAFCRVLPVNDIPEDDMFVHVMSQTQLQTWQKSSASMEERRRHASKTLTLPAHHRPTQSAGNLKKKWTQAMPLTARLSWGPSTIPAKLPQTNSCPPNGFPDRPNPKVFFFDHIFGQDTPDKEVHDAMMEEIVTAWDGMPVTIVAYGATGTGKTHTINSIAERAISEFDSRAEIAKKSGEEVTLKVTLLEVYNEQIRDLLGDPVARLKVVGSDSPRAGGAVEWTVDPHNVGAELRRALDLGRSNRSTSVTNIHQHSSRSHLVLTVKVIIRSHDIIIKSGKLTLVDLAGSERLKRSEAEGERLVETKHINKSLSALGDVIWAYERKVRFIPFRNSKLTHLLQSSLGLEKSRTVVIVTCSPTIAHANETLNSLQFGAKINSITIPSNSSVLASSAEHTVLKSQAQEERKLRESLERQVTELKSVLNKERKTYLSASSTPKFHTGRSGFNRKLVTGPQAKAVNTQAPPTKNSASRAPLSARHTISGYPLDHAQKPSSDDKRASRPSSCDKRASTPKTQSPVRMPLARLETPHKDYIVKLHNKLALAKDKIHKLERKLDQKTKALDAATQELHALRCICSGSSNRPTLKDLTKDWVPVLSGRRMSTSNSSVINHTAENVVADPLSNSRSGPLRSTFYPVSRQKTAVRARSRPTHMDRVNDKQWDTPRDPPRPHPVLPNLDLSSFPVAPYDDVAHTVDRRAQTARIYSDGVSSSVSTPEITPQDDSQPSEPRCADGTNENAADDKKGSDDIECFSGASDNAMKVADAAHHVPTVPLPPGVTPEASIDSPALLPKGVLKAIESATPPDYAVQAHNEFERDAVSAHSESGTPSKCPDPDGVLAQKDCRESETSLKATIQPNNDMVSPSSAQGDIGDSAMPPKAVTATPNATCGLPVPVESTASLKKIFVVEEISETDVQRIVGQEPSNTSLGAPGTVSPALLLRPVHDGAAEDGVLEWPIHSPISLSSTGSEIKERLGKILPACTPIPQWKSSAGSKAGPSPRDKGPSARTSIECVNQRNSPPLYKADYRRAMTPRRYSGTSPRADGRPRWR